MLTEYRNRFRQYQTALARAEYLYLSGQHPYSDAASIQAENSDLFSATTTTDLRLALAEVSDQRETDRAAIKRLIAFAVTGSVAAKVRELSQEITVYEKRATVHWQEQTIPWQTARDQMALETDRQQRREMFARCSEITRGADDLRAERLARLHEAAHTAGYASYLALYGEVRGIDYEKLAQQPGAFLAMTETRYIAALAAALPRETQVSLNEATRADLNLFLSFSRFDEAFPPWRLCNVYQETFRSMGIRMWQQHRLTVEERQELRTRATALCVPLVIPDDVRLLFRTGGGQRAYQTFLHAAGRAQQFAWTSLHLFPEFQYSGDNAVPQAWGALLQFLLHDPGWLTEMLGFYAGQEFVRTLALHKLLQARRDAALLTYEVELHTERLRDTARARYAELLSEAVRVQYDDTNHLSDVSDNFAPADRLRAWAFAAQLREYLKSKYGSRWWTARRTGEMLTDLWNTGMRYSVDELAAQIGLGELSYEWLAEDLLGQI